jgi:hypothetical protein
MSPEISTTNRVRYRVAAVEKDWLQVLALVREAAAKPDYSGPPPAAVEQVAGAIAALRTQVRNWTLDEQLRRASRPRIASRGQSRIIRQAIRGA